MTFSLTWLPQILRAWGLNVVETPGWQTRGHGDMGEVKGVLLHHTNGALHGNMPSLQVLIDGRPDLAGPLSQLGLGRDGTYYIVCAGKGWHAGAGAWHGITDGNGHMIGIEAENVGDASDPWPSVQMDAYRRGVAAILTHIGASAIMCAGHKEYALPAGRKDDPDFDMNKFRADVAAIIAAPAHASTSVSSTKRMTGITATVFGGSSDPNTSAYDSHPISDTELGVALPYRFPAPIPRVRVYANGKSVDCSIVDVGPWNINDPYWETGSRPQAESGTDKNSRETNLAGIDLTPAAAKAIGIQGKGIVDWEFSAAKAPVVASGGASVANPTTPAPTAATAPTPQPGPIVPPSNPQPAPPAKPETTMTTPTTTAAAAAPTAAIHDVVIPQVISALETAKTWVPRFVPNMPWWMQFVLAVGVPIIEGGLNIYENKDTQSGTDLAHSIGGLIQNIGQGVQTAAATVASTPQAPAGAPTQGMPNAG